MTAQIKPGVAEQVAGALRRAIVQGRLQPGDALPSERELAAQYEVNRSSIREAMKRLEAWGLVRIRQGGATRVSDFLMHAGLELLPALVEVGARVDPGILRDLHQIRGLLLGWCAEQAARKADAASAHRLEQLARRLADPREKPAALQALDYEFFEELVQISGNRILLLLSNMVKKVYLGSKGRFLALYRPGVFEPGHHARAAAAIRARDPRAAGEAMRAHAATALITVEEEP